MFTNMGPDENTYIVSAGVRFSGGGKQECGGAILVVLLLHKVHVSALTFLGRGPCSPDLKS